MSELTITLSHPIDEADALVRNALKEQGFGILTEINVANVFREKLGVERTPLKILGACNPSFANEAIQRDIDVALALPCNVVLDGASPDSTVVTIADPTTMMPSSEFADLVLEVRQSLLRVIEQLGEQ